jgi:hypothetical protein
MAKADKLADSDMTRETRHDAAAGGHLGDNAGHIISTLGPGVAPDLMRASMASPWRPLMAGPP